MTGTTVNMCSSIIILLTQNFAVYHTTELWTSLWILSLIFYKALFNIRHNKSSISHNAHQFRKLKYHTFLSKLSHTFTQQQFRVDELIPRVQLQQNLTYKHKKTRTAKWAASLSTVLPSTTNEQVRKIRLLDLNRPSNHLLRQLHHQPLRFN